MNALAYMCVRLDKKGGKATKMGVSTTAILAYYGDLQEGSRVAEQYVCRIVR